jgi:SAM-dependent MidA family methyltransferase
MKSTQPLNVSTPQPSALVLLLRDRIRREGPISFASFMEEALYHPEHGYYSSGRCAIGRRGDYFTSASVGPLFGKLMAGQFVEIWEKLERPDDFVIVEQGAHHGEFATDVLEALRETRPDFFAALRYRIVEPFPILRKRQEAVLRGFAQKTEWSASIEEMAPFCGVHFSNELLDALPVHLLVADHGEWRERLVERTSDGFAFTEKPVTNPRLRARLAKISPMPDERYETEINLAALDWMTDLAPKLRRGISLIADYGLTRFSFYAPGRTSGTLQSYAEHRVLRSPLEEVGTSDLTTHVEWTSLAERAEETGLTITGFTDQHHFLTGLLAADPALAAASAEQSRALQTLLHPEFMGTKFQFLGLSRNFASAASLGGFKFAREARTSLGLT